MTTQGLLSQLASQGQGGDTELALVNPQEAQLLKSLGGSGTINPKTGLRQYDYRLWSDPLNLHHNTWEGGPDFSWDEAWDHTLGNQGVGGMLNNIFTGGEQDIDFLGLGDIWNSWIGNHGIVDWISDRVGFGFNLDDGFYGGSHPGSDAAWNSAAAGLGPMIESIGELEILRNQIIDSFETGTDIFNEGTDLYNQGTDAYFKGRGLLGQISREQLPPQLRAYENLLGQSGSKFGVSSGPTDPRNTSGDAYNRSVFEARNVERSRRGGELTRQGNESTRQQNYLDALWGVMAKARGLYEGWWGGILSPEYQEQAPTFEDVTADMDWLTPPEDTTWQPDYPTTVPG